MFRAAQKSIATTAKQIKHWSMSLWSPVTKDLWCVSNALCVGAMLSPFPDALWELDTCETTSARRTALLFCFHTSFVAVPKLQMRVGKQCLQLDLTEDGRKPSQWQIWRTSNRIQTESVLSRFGAISVCFKQFLSFPLHSHRAWKAESRAGTILTFLTTEE